MFIKSGYLSNGNIDVQAKRSVNKLELKFGCQAKIACYILSDNLNICVNVTQSCD